RYGNPIIILNLIKTNEKKPRETILRTAFANAVNFINQNLSGDKHLRFLHLDLHRQSRRSKATNVLLQLGKVAAIALKLTGIFYCPVAPNTWLEGLFPYSYSANNDVYETVVFAYGLVALGHQLQALGFIEDPHIDLDNSLATEVMKAYESMGDTIAFQYGGSAAHNKIFSERRGQWKAAAQSQEFIRTIQRYYNNTCLDGAKQNAINIFLGHFQPHQGKPALWELDSDQHYNIGSHGPNLADGIVGWPFIRRSQSDYILGESDATIRNLHAPDCQHSSENPNKRSLLESPLDTFTCESSICDCWQIYGGMGKDQYCKSDHICYEEHEDASDCSNFLDVDWLSSSGNSCEEELLERFSCETLMSSSCYFLHQTILMPILLIIQINQHLLRQYCE
ncbi:variant 4, suppressor of actin mutation, partial [Lathyrus oleraceus]